jgi:hypothetical protein
MKDGRGDSGCCWIFDDESKQMHERAWKTSNTYGALHPDEPAKQ